MKIFNKTILVVVTFISLSLSTGCKKYLDVSDEIAESLTLEQVFENPVLIRRWHGGLFSCITEYSSIGMNDPNGFAGVWVPMASESTLSANGFWPMINGFTAANADFQRWGTLYKIIRDANIFIARVAPRGSVNDQYVLSEQEVKRMKAEAKFLIAYSYFSLFELYGPVPLVTEILDPQGKELDFPRASVDETVAYIDQLLVEAVQSGDLPETLIKNSNVTGNDKYNLNEIVRPTVTAALALRAKLAVYAASPVFNGGYQETLTLANPDGKALFRAYDREKWVTAKKRLEELFANTTKNGHKLFKAYTNGVFDADQSVYQLFQIYNDEILWATGKNGYNGSTAQDENTNPRDMFVGWSYIGISQNAVDAFFVKDGLTIEESKLYKEDGFTDVLNPCNENKRIDKNVFNMYANREPRFYAGIAYQGKSWSIQPPGRPDYTIGFARGQGTDNSSADNPRTGYLPAKFKNRQILFTDGYPWNWARPSILLRLADFYLYYAEVCNEVDANDPNVITYLDLVRERAGIPGYRQLAAEGKKNIIGNQAMQRKMIQRERRVELFAEGQRFFDIRRWMVADDKDEDPRLLYAMNMNGYSDRPVGAADSYFTRVLLERRSWTRALYLYPIPQADILRSKFLVQNPLW